MPLKIVGDIIPSDTLKGTVKLGPGLSFTNSNIICSKSGLLYSNDNSFHIQSSQKLFLPSQKDPVIGTIISKNADCYKVDIGGPFQASLPLLGFDGATKRNAPNLAINSLVYCKVVLADKHMDPELECFNQGDTGFGPLSGEFSYLHSVNLYYARLLYGEHPIWNAIAKKIALEVCVGLNGKIWFSSSSVLHIVLVLNLLKVLDGVYPKIEDSSVEISQESFDEWQVVVEKTVAQYLKRNQPLL